MSENELTTVLWQCSSAQLVGGRVLVFVATGLQFFQIATSIPQYHTASLPLRHTVTTEPSAGLIIVVAVGERQHIPGVGQEDLTRVRLDDSDAGGTRRHSRLRSVLLRKC